MPIRVFQPGAPHGEILEFIRDTLIAWGHRRRTLMEQSALIAQIPIDDEELQELAAVDGAVKILQFIISAGQDAKSRGHSAPEWVLHIAYDARSALVDEADNPLAVE